jgi:hypothetical protein
MEHLFSRSVSGRVFSRPESFHRDACRVGLKGASVVINEGMSFDPKLLAFVKYAVWFYRHTCDCGWWDMGGFINSLDEIERIEGDEEWYFSGALLFCVDRALACYQRNPQSLLRLEWSRSAHFLRFALFSLGDPAMAKGGGISASAVGKIAAHARHAKNRETAEAIKAWWRESKDSQKSMDAAAECASLKFGVAFRTARNHIGVEAKKLRSARKE